MVCYVLYRSVKYFIYCSVADAIILLYYCWDIAAATANQKFILYYRRRHRCCNFDADAWRTILSWTDIFFCAKIILLYIFLCNFDIRIMRANINFFLLLFFAFIQKTNHFATVKLIFCACHFRFFVYFYLFFRDATY